MLSRWRRQCLCQSEEPQMSGGGRDDTTVMNGKLRTIDEAAEIAQQGIAMIEGPAASRFGSRRRFDKGAVKAVTSPLSRSGVSDTLLYVFNFDNNQGYAIVAAPRVAEGLIAVTESGRYDPVHGTGNPGADMFIESAAIQLDSIIKVIDPDNPFPGGGGGNTGGGDDQKAQYRNVIDTVAKTRVYPRLGTLSWGNGYPEGRYCPNKIAGSASVAAAMAMSYFEYPTTIKLEQPGRTNVMYDFDWSVMKIHQKSYKDELYNLVYDKCGSEEAHEKLGVLCYEIGYRANTRYETQYTRSSTTVNNLYSAMQNLSFSLGEIKDLESSSFFVQVPDKTLYIMCGEDSNKIAGYWVVDGVNAFTLYLEEWILYPGASKWEKHDRGFDYHTYLHINWGLMGDSNGYFSIKAIDPKKPTSLDNGSSVYRPDNESYLHKSNMKVFMVSRP